MPDEIDKEKTSGASRATTRPAPHGLKSQTVVSLQLASCLVFVCLWLPLCRGCSGTIEIPVDNLKLTSLTNFDDLLFQFLLLGSYCNGVLTATLISIAAWFVSEKLWRLFFQVQFCISLIGGVALVLFSLIHSSSTKEFVETCLSTIPALTGVAIWVGLPMRRNCFQTAWARLQHTWTVVALMFVHLLMLFKSTAMYGYWLTLFGLAGMFIAVEQARYRMTHDLWDASQDVVRPQFSIRSLLIWTAFFPVVLSYYRAIQPFCDWLFFEMES